MFYTSQDIVTDEVPMGYNEFFSAPGELSKSPAKNVILIRATIRPNQGHGFHYHQDREEFIYILEGEVEQWIDKEKRICGPGDVVFIPPGVVHASFNKGENDVKLLAIFGPLDAEAELTTDVSDEAPWDSLQA